MYYAGYDIIWEIIKDIDEVQSVSKLSGKNNRRTQIASCKKPFANGFEICFYSLSSILIDETEYSRITLDLNGKFLNLIKVD